MQKQPEKTRNKCNSPSRMIRLGLAAVLVFMLIYGVSGLISYFRDLHNEKTTAAEQELTELILKTAARKGK